MWDRMSGASDVMTATTPSGTSSSPVTADAIRTVGSVKIVSWTSLMLATTILPAAPSFGPGDTICHVGMCPSARKMAPAFERTSAAGAELPPRSTSSVKRATLHASGVLSGFLFLIAAPTTSAAGCSSACTRSTNPPIARWRRSTTATPRSPPRLPHAETSPPSSLTSAAQSPRPSTSSRVCSACAASAAAARCVVSSSSPLVARGGAGGAPKRREYASDSTARSSAVATLRSERDARERSTSSRACDSSARSR
mmetsp:Transcript_61687/g.141219  ORF Transcript_61687/g.141219 Transcript_61687/m.141219 type:complete len:254 (-) Transcript_61687:1200-1961(-)